MKKISFILLVLSQIVALAASPVKFQTGEKVVYHASYNWGFIWVNAGLVEFTVNDAPYDSNAYLFKAIGSTYKKYDMFFKVRDTVSSVVSKNNLLPIYARKATFEGSYYDVERYSFDHHKKNILGWKKTKTRDARDTLIAMPANTFDILSAIYQIREYNFDLFTLGQKLPLNLTIDNGIYNMYIKYKGKTVVKLPGGRRFRVIQFSPMLKEGSVFKGGEGMNIYVTDDRNHLPVLIESEIKVGSVKAILLTTENLRYPLDAEIFRD